MKLNSFKFFAIIALFTSITYYFQHIRLADFVFEDYNWLLTNSYQWSWYDLYAIPGNRITLITFMYNTPKIAHTINLIIHLMNGLFLSLLIQSWFRQNFGWITGSLFLINPLSIQAVAYASGRGEMLALAFLIGFLWFATVSELSFDTRWFWLLMCLFGMANTKATILAASIPLLIWVYMSDTKIDFLNGLGYLISISFLAIPYVIYKYLNVFQTSTIPIPRWFAVQSYATWRLSFEALTGYGLAIDHAWWLASDLIQVLSALAIIGVFIAIMIVRFNPISFGIGWWIISFSPRLFSHVNLGWIREHHAYVSLVGFCLVIAVLIDKLSRSYAGNYSKEQSCTLEYV